MSYAVDDMMEHIGLDAAYRESTHCTLYTVELHMHYLHEIKQSDWLAVSTSVLDSDRKRIHAGCEFLCPRIEGPAATAELMLLHVRQGEKPSVVSFPVDIEQRLASLRLSPEAAASGVSARARSSSGAARPACGLRHTTSDRAAQHRAHRRERVDRRRGGRQCHYRLSRHGVARASDARVDTERPFYRSIAELPGHSRCGFHRRAES